MPDPSPTPAAPGGNGLAEGVLELDNQQAGFLRDGKRNYVVRPEDPYVSPDAIRKFGLRGGETLVGPKLPVMNKGNRAYKLTRIDRINGVAAADSTQPVAPTDTTPIYPTEPRFDTPGGRRACGSSIFSRRSGPRGLIVAPPRPARPSCCSRWPTASPSIIPRCT